MKSFKNILVSVLLVLSISFYWGHDIVDFINHITKIENTTNCADTQGLVSSEFSIEEDIPSIISKNSDEIMNQGCQSFGSFTCTFPSKVYCSIWLPPEIS
jgi:hypothetical protein